MRVRRAGRWDSVTGASEAEGVRAMGGGTGRRVPSAGSRAAEERGRLAPSAAADRVGKWAVGGAVFDRSSGGSGGFGFTAARWLPLERKLRMETCFGGGLAAGSLCLLFEEDCMASGQAGRQGRPTRQVFERNWPSRWSCVRSLGPGSSRECSCLNWLELNGVVQDALCCLR